MISLKSKNKEFRVVFHDQDKKSGSINGSAFSWDVAKINDGSFHIIKDGRSYLADVVKADPEKKTFRIKVNGSNYDLHLPDRYDSLLKEMGLDIAETARIREVKAPMPGLVLDIAVSAGQAVKTGETLIVLEAMKMENILKAPADAVVKKINVMKRDAVEKNAVLITFE